MVQVAHPEINPYSASADDAMSLLAELIESSSPISITDEWPEKSQVVCTHNIIFAKGNHGRFSIQLLVKFLNFFQSLLFGHLITATASIWHAQPVLCSIFRPINSISLLKHSPCNKCHADNRYMPEHVVCDRERLAYIKTESQAPKTEQQNGGDPPNIYWCMPQRVEIGV